MVAVANQENMIQTLRGFLSVPRPYAGKRGFEIRMWDHNGSWHTPWFGEEHDPNYYEEDKYYNLVIDIPKNLSVQIGSGSLVIQLEVDTREEEGWQEEVSYWEGSKYKLYTERKTWEDAEATCQRNGGHLASVLSDGEQEEVRAAMGAMGAMGSMGAMGEGGWLWVGATDSEEEGVWRWADGSLWGYHNWAEWYGHKGNNSNCVVISMYDDYKWRTTSCTDNYKYAFLCQSSPVRVLAGIQSLVLKYSAQNLTFPSLNIHYHYTANQQWLDSWQDKRMTGFRLTWFLKHSNGSRLTGTHDMAKDCKLRTKSPGYAEQQLVNMVQLATQARTENLGSEEVIHRTLLEKKKIIQSAQLDYASMCKGGQIKPNHYGLIHGLNIGLNNSTGGEASGEDALTGFMMFSTMIFCSESVPLYQFLHSLLSTQSPRTIIQATVNTIEAGDIKERSNRKRISQFYLVLDKIFHFQLGKILLATVSSSDIEAMMAKDWPYFSHFTEEIKKCLNHSSCNGVRDLVKSLGKHNSSSVRHCYSKT